MDYFWLDFNPRQPRSSPTDAASPPLILAWKVARQVYGLYLELPTICVRSNSPFFSN